MIFWVLIGAIMMVLFIWWIPNPASFGTFEHGVFEVIFFVLGIMAFINAFDEFTGEDSDDE